MFHLNLQVFQKLMDIYPKNIAIITSILDYFPRQILKDNLNDTNHKLTWLNLSSHDHNDAKQNNSINKLKRAIINTLRSVIPT